MLNKGSVTRWLAFVFVLFLGACSFEQFDKDVLRYKPEETIEAVTTVESKEDVVKKISLEMIVSTSNMTPEQIKQIETNVALTKQTLGVVPGLEFNHRFENGKVVQIMTIDATNAENLKKLNEFNILPYKLADNEQHLSRQRVLEELKKQGHKAE